MEIAGEHLKKIRENFTIEMCPYCGKEEVIYAQGITPCPDCGNLILPCSCCEDCTDNCPYEIFETGEYNRNLINNPIDPEFSSKLYKYL